MFHIYTPWKHPVFWFRDVYCFQWGTEVEHWLKMVKWTFYTTFDSRGIIITFVKLMNHLLHEIIVQLAPLNGVYVFWKL